MPKVEEDEVVPVATLDSAAQSGSSDPDMKVTLLGKCPASTYSLRVVVDRDEYSAGQGSATLKNNSGIPIGTCTGGVMTISYPVPSPRVARTITFKVKARLNNGKSSGDWAVRSFAYAPPIPAIPGFAVIAVGGVSSATSTSDGFSYTMYGSGGEAIGGPNIDNGALYSFRSGVFGVLLE